MKSRVLILIALILILSLLATAIPGCYFPYRPFEAAESYVAIIPKVLHSGSTEALSLSLFSEGRPVRDRVEVVLLSDGEEIQKVKKDIYGKGTIEISVPEVEEGEYEIQVKGTGFEDKVSVRVEKSFLVFLETDKPIYKPGQTIHIRTITLNSELGPLSESVTIEVLDARGIKIFRSEVDTDDFGLAMLDLPVSCEPNLGVWKLTAVTEKAKTQLDVRVEEYVLPKYEVKTELPREWFMVNEPITGIISAEYSFGKPVKGELEIKAFRYVGEWQEYATFSRTIDGETEFELPAVDYVAGVPAAGGMGNVMLNISVTEKATGYVEKTSRLLTVADSPLNIQIIPESSVFKPGLPFSFLIITETPGNELVETKVKAIITYLNNEYQEIRQDEKVVETSKGKKLIEISPPENSVALTIETIAEGAQASKVIEASYSPSGNFIHVEQISEGISQLGQEVRFKVHSTRQAVNFYYEVISRGKVVFTDFTRNSEIAFDATPLMTPSSRLLVYQILSNSEVSADYIPFKVELEYPHDVKAEFSQQEARPGEKVSIEISTEGEARVGIAAVDKSVFILAENRLNMQQVFDELERLYMAPQVELHEASIYPAITTRGAMEVFDDAGVVVLSNNKIPEGKEYQWQEQTGFWEGVWNFFNGRMIVEEAVAELAVEMEEAAPEMAGKSTEDGTSGLAEVERVRQYFPETWLWEVITTDFNGKASLEVEVPDTITTWMLRAVALSKEKGLGVAEDELRAFQPFFLKVDLPYSVIRGEEFPVSVAVYNYLDQSQDVLVQIEEEDWFELLDDSEKTVRIEANDIRGVDFKIKVNKLGINKVKITARSKESADAVIKTVIIEPEGITRELVENLVLSGESYSVVDTFIPLNIVEDSGRAYIALTSSYLTQTIDGLEELIQMPFGCGEQNMVVFAPDVYITKYLEESGQIKPEIMAKAEKMMITGYQRELTYRRSDGSFSAFGQDDKEGSLWLTAFVLKCFSQAKELMYIDDSVLDQASDWINAHQNSDGSFDQVGFVHHQEMMGGLQGKNALTAYIAIALLEAEETTAAGKAIGFLERNLDEIDNAYTMAITTYALELAGSYSSDDAYQMLIEMAQEDVNGLYWSSGSDSPETLIPEEGRSDEEEYLPVPGTASIEATGYATMALIEHGNTFNASRAAKWLVSQRNAYGGYGSTQDTVVALQALTEYSTGARADVDLELSIETAGEETKLSIRQDNFDVLQIVEVPINEEITIIVKGEGEAMAQVVKRFNLPRAEEEEEILQVSVGYDVTQVEVNDIVKVSVGLEFNPPIDMEAGMVVLDVSVPTGFAPVTGSIAEVVEMKDNIKRYEIAGRKVIFYIENMFPGDRVSFDFQVKALYPVKAKSVSSQAYSYYKPEIRGETLSQELSVSGS